MDCHVALRAPRNDRNLPLIDFQLPKPEPHAICRADQSGLDDSGPPCDSAELCNADDPANAFCETPDDPHSPVVLGLGEVLSRGAELYQAADTEETRAKWGKGTPDDWMERHVYGREYIGIGLMFAIDVLLFGLAGISVWAIQMMWIR